MARNPAPDLPQLEPRTRAEWRRWLQRNHDTAPGVSFVFVKVSTGRQKVSYDDAVEEALCFGWIDSVAHTLDDERYQVRFTKQTWPGEVLTSRIVVAGKREEDGDRLVDVTVELVNQDGEIKLSGNATALAA